MAMVSCENQDTDFPDFDYQTGYFAYQTPIRTLVLGNDERADNSIDNAHKCRIKAVVGGTRNGIKATLGFDVDPSLCDNLFFSDGTPVKPMPAEYYTLAAGSLQSLAPLIRVQIFGIEFVGIFLSRAPFVTRKRVHTEVGEIVIFQLQIIELR